MTPLDLRKWSGFTAAGGIASAPAWIDQVVVDSRRLFSPTSLFVALPGSRTHGHDFVLQAAQAGARFVLVQSGFALSYPLPNHLQLLRVRDPLLALQEIAAVYRKELPLKLVAITGSFGKTMLKDLLYSLLHPHQKTAASPESFNSQIGVALSIFSFPKEAQIGLVEAAISEREEMNKLATLLQPDHTILTTIGKKHLSTLGGMEILAEESMQLVSATSPNGWGLLPKNPLFSAYLSHCPVPVYFWDVPTPSLPHIVPIATGSSSPQFAYRICFPDGESWEQTLSMGYKYLPNLLNMACKAAWLLGVSRETIQKTLSLYQPEPMKTELWKSPQGTLFVTEPYCSDAQSIQASLRQFAILSQEKRPTFVFGGMRGQVSEKTYETVGAAILDASISRLLLHGKGPFGSLIHRVQTASPEAEILSFPTETELLDYLKTDLSPKDALLFKGEKKIPLDRLVELTGERLNHNLCWINLAAIRSNLQVIQQRVGKDTRLMVMVKAFGYGTDHLQMARFYLSCGIDFLGVSYVEEARTLKKSGVSQSIFCLHATPDEAKEVVELEIEVGVSDRFLIEALAKEARSLHKKARLHLHVDTGMGRFGCRPEEALSLAQTIQQKPELILEGIMTHLSSADVPEEDAFSRSQILQFTRISQQLHAARCHPRWVHAANSSGVARFSLPQCNLVRVGLAAYGLYPSEAVEEAMPLKLALTLSSSIVGFNQCYRGESVGYGRSHIVLPEKERIAIIPLGYFDGLHRKYSKRAFFLVRGQKAPIVGNICMDYTMIDVSLIPDATIGDPVLIFGEDGYGQYLAPEALAAQGQSNAHELMTCLGPRIQRIFLFEEGDTKR